MTLCSLASALLLTAPAATDARKPEVATYAFLQSAAAARDRCAAAKPQGELVRVPLFAERSGACPIATVGGDVITLRDLTDVLAAGHEPRVEAAAQSHGKQREMDFAPALGRLIETRLIAAEAHAMGLDDLPEVKSAIDEFKTSTLRALVERRAAKGIVPEALEVERAYKEVVRQWRVQSLLFANEAGARSFSGSVQGGKAFEDAARQALAEKKATGSDKPEALAPSAALPQIARAIQTLKPGGVSDVIPVTNGFVVLRLDGMTYPDDPKAKAEAEAQSLRRQKQAALQGYFNKLVRKYAKVDRAALAKLDLEAKKPGFEALLKDRRVLARIRGGQPITVAELAAEVAKQFLHGLEKPTKEHRVNPQKAPAFEALLSARVFAREAAALDLQSSAEFRREVDEYTRGVAFTAFLEKAIVPDVKVSEEEVKAYFDVHAADYTSPQMYRLESLGFTSAKGAQSARDKLKAGTDWSWMRANADGQLAPDDRALQLEGTATVSASMLPHDLAEALTGARAGDYRLYAAPASQHYVVRVLDATPPRLQPYQDAREPIARKLYAEKVGKAIKDYAEKLRKTQRVEVFLTRIGT